MKWMFKRFEPRMKLQMKHGYGFLFSVRRVFHEPFTVKFTHAARFVLGLLVCYLGEAMRTEKRNS
jgi:hypothetical protein